MIDITHYLRRKYNHKIRWMNYWHQIDEILETGAGTVLEVGKGNGIVSDYLRKVGIQITTIDIDSTTRPDVVGSVASLPFEDDQFDLVLAAEILEHLPQNEIKIALSELKRVSKEKILIT